MTFGLSKQGKLLQKLPGKDLSLITLTRGGIEGDNNRAALLDELNKCVAEGNVIEQALSPPTRSASYWEIFAMVNSPSL